MSPEICAKSSYDGPASDIWAAGVILFTMLFGYQPFKAPTEKELYKKILKGSFVMPSTTFIPNEGRAYSESQIESPSKKAPLRSPQNIKQSLLQKMLDKNTKNEKASATRRASKAASMQEVFENYPLIQNAATIKSLISDMLCPNEANRATAREI